MSPAEPCMLFKENELGVCIIIMYVDDMLIICKKGTDTRICDQNTETIFCKDPTQITDYLGCEFHMNKVKTRGWLGQPSKIKSSEQSLETEQ